MSIQAIKFVTTAVLVALNSISSLIALYIGFRDVNSDKFSMSWSTVFSVLNHFSIGLFIGLSIVGLYSGSAVKLQIVQRKLLKSTTFQHYPLPETILCLGIFFLFALEWFLHKVMYKVCEYDMQKSLHKNNGLQKHSECTQVEDLSDADEVELLMWSKNSNVNSSPRNKKLKYSSSNRNSYDKQYFSFGKSVLLSCALSLHSFFEGVSFGVMNSFDQVISMTVGMVMHQFLCAATLAFRLTQSSVTHIKRYIAIFVLLCYLLVFPSGVLSGYWFYESFTNSNVTNPNLTSLTNNSFGLHEHEMSGYIVIGLVQNFAASSFLYVILFDALPAVLSVGVRTSSMNHCNYPTSQSSGIRILCFCCLLMGFMLFCGLRILHH
ncbi:Zinc transporter ZIP1 isoform 1 [Schistosoma japonicum]|uniref:Zinc transporter ZIP1 isoform 1 n=1 Tax=Schistosoma japonicum TaxID=6182 RepID=A0A4Z2D7R8_SCHJA|nr:Zinc transporter ZIP1 isoform 1 [Schistosoma japonicum]